MEGMGRWQITMEFINQQKINQEVPPVSNTAPEAINNLIPAPVIGQLPVDGGAEQIDQEQFAKFLEF